MSVFVVVFIRQDCGAQQVIISSFLNHLLYNELVKGNVEEFEL